MLSFEQIKEYFDSYLARLNPKGILIEYLQYEFLDSLFKLRGSEKISFIGGTAIRIIHNSDRFSEDLDFDNFGLNYNAFKILLDKVYSELHTKGFKMEKRFLAKESTYHCYLKFTDILFRLRLSSHREEKIFLSVDAQKKRKLFSPEIKTLNKFGIFRNILVNPVQILLAQKLLTILLRRREKGRDFYDASFLAGKTKPDYKYIKKLTGLNQNEFAQELKKRCAEFNFKSLAQEVEAFLFNAEEKNRVLTFRENLDDILGLASV